MAVNVPSVSTSKLSFGPGVLSILHIASGAVSTVVEGNLVDVGAVRSGTFSVTRTRLDLLQGSPQTLITQFVTKEDVQLSVNGLEWDLPQLALALGAGVTTGTTTQTLGFGGALSVSDVAVKYVHILPAGWTVTLRMWKAQGSGEVSVTFGDDFHEIPYVFNATETQPAGQQWGTSGVLPATERLFRLTLQK